MIVDQAVSPEFSGSLLAMFGLVSFAIAAFFLLLQHNYKRLLAYSSIEHMGLAMIGFGVGGAIGIFGGLFHLINHAFAKSMAFFAAGNIHRRYQSVEIDQVHGLATVLPGTALSLMVAGLALAALPPFALFASEMQIVTALGTVGPSRRVGTHRRGHSSGYLAALQPRGLCRFSVSHHRHGLGHRPHSDHAGRALVRGSHCAHSVEPGAGGIVLGPASPVAAIA